MNRMLERLLNTPIIAAVKTGEELAQAIASPCEVIFVLYGDVCGIAGVTESIRQAGKLAIVHLDLIDGLSPREASVRFLKEYTAADGLISTKTALVRRAKELGLIAVQRFFLLDSLSVQNATQKLASEPADFVEVLPGVIPKLIGRIARSVEIPVIAGGLIEEKEDILRALGAGAAAVSTTDARAWFD